MKRHNAIKNTITAVLDEYFPEFGTVFKQPFKGKASMQVMKSCPFPSLILELGVDGVLAQIKKAVKKTVGFKKAKQLAEDSKSLHWCNLWDSISKTKIGFYDRGIRVANKTT